MNSTKKYNSNCLLGLEFLGLNYLPKTSQIFVFQMFGSIGWLELRLWDYWKHTGGNGLVGKGYLHQYQSATGLLFKSYKQKVCIA